MGSSPSIHIDVDTRNPSALQELAERRPYVVTVKGKKTKVHYCKNADEVRKLMVPAGPMTFGEYVPASVHPITYV